MGNRELSYADTKCFDKHTGRPSPTEVALKMTLANQNQTETAGLKVLSLLFSCSPFYDFIYVTIYFFFFLFPCVAIITT